VTFRPDLLGARAQGTEHAGVVDYRLARQALLSEFRKGRLARHQVCDAHPELVRNARELGAATRTRSSW
jgi:hypothetical protein